MSVASDWPARKQPDGRKFYRPAEYPSAQQWGWTADLAQADPSYLAELRARLSSQSRSPARSGPPSPSRDHAPAGASTAALATHNHERNRSA
jgi:hypothetical protein